MCLLRCLSIQIFTRTSERYSMLSPRTTLYSMKGKFDSDITIWAAIIA